MNEDLTEIFEEIKKFSRVEDITDIIILGNKNGKGFGVRRIILDNEKV